MKNFFTVLVVFFLTEAVVFALEVVYPKNNSQITAGSTFFVGNTNKDAKLFINDIEVKVYDNGSFVHVVALPEAQNIFILKSVLNDTEEKLTYKILKPKPNAPASFYPDDFVPAPSDDYLYFRIVAANTPIRLEPNDNSARLTHLPPNTLLRVSGVKRDFYRVYLNEVQSGWVKNSSVVEHITLKQKQLAKIDSVEFDCDGDYSYILIKTDKQMPFKLTELSENKLLFELFGADAAELKINTFRADGFKLIDTYSNDTLKLEITLNEKLWGYDCVYDDNFLCLKIRKPPSVNIKKPFENIAIALDPGHGGKEYGSVGPTGVREKDINLDISLKLKTILELQGATVVMTRYDDSYVDLYERIRIAQQSNALLLVSIHANALPDGADPYKKHGTSVFYYNNQAKVLADTIKKELTSSLSTADDGTNKASFALVRPSSPLSVLVEVLYMIHPYEYSLLLDEKFRQNAAQSLSEALKKHLLTPSAPHKN